MMDTVTPAEVLADALAPCGNNLAAAICAISSKLEAIPKLGVNDFHKYSYARMPDLLRILAPLMSRHGVTVLQSETGHELIADGVLRVEFNFDIVHAPSGEVHTIRSSGMAKVSGERGGFNDRAIQAIGTTVKKYVLIALFNVVVDEMPDNDHDTASDTRRKTTLPKKDSRGVYQKLAQEIQSIISVSTLRDWGEANRERIAVLPIDWQDHLRLLFHERLVALRELGAKALETKPAVVWDTDRVRAPTPDDFDNPPPSAKPAVRTVMPAPKHSLKAGGIAERAIAARSGPSKPFLASDAGKAFNRRLHPMNDELPGDLGPPKKDDGFGIPDFLDRRNAEPSYIDLVGGAR